MKIKLADLYSSLEILLYAKIRNPAHMGIKQGPLYGESYILVTTLLYQVQTDEIQVDTKILKDVSSSNRFKQKNTCWKMWLINLSTSN